jgi:hypothetical protein
MDFFIDFSLLKRNRNFALLYLGQFVSFFGTMITGVALPYQIYHQTHSTLMVGLLSLAQLIPLLVTALLGGVLADRHHRKRLLLSTETLLAIGGLLLAWNAILAVPHLWVLFIVSSIMSAINGLHRPAMEGIVQQIIAKDDFIAASALRGLTYSVCMIGGPAVGGLIIAHLGLVTTYLVDFASFLIALCSVLMIDNMPKPTVERNESVLSALTSGIRYAFSKQELLGTYIVDFVAMIFGMPTALFPAIAQSFGGVQTLGMLYAAPAVGALVVSFFSGLGNYIRYHGLAVAVSAVLWGVAIIFFGLSSQFYVALFFLALAGAADAVSGLFRMTMWNTIVPQGFRGRLAGIEMISYLSGPKLGDTEAGLVAAAFGVTASVVSGGVLCVVGVGVCCLFLPKFWRYQACVDNNTVKS